MIKESGYLEINRAYLQRNVPLFVLAGLNDILWLFQSDVEVALKVGTIYFKISRFFYHWLVCNKSLQTLGLTGYLNSDANKRLRNLIERCKINRKLIKQATISRSKTDLFSWSKDLFRAIHIFSPFSIFKWTPPTTRLGCLCCEVRHFSVDAAELREEDCRFPGRISKICSRLIREE